MTTNKAILNSITFGDSIKSRLSDEIQKAIREGNVEAVYEYSNYHCHEAVVYADEDQLIQVTPDNLQDIPDFKNRLTQLYCGDDPKTGKPDERIDHATARNAITVHYLTRVKGEVVKVLADAESLYLLRVLTGGIVIQKQIKLAETLAIEIGRTVSSIAHRESEEDAREFLSRLILIQRQLKQALAVAEEGVASTQTVLTAIKQSGV